MKKHQELIRNVLNAHCDVVNAEVALAHDQDQDRAVRKAEEADLRFKDAINTLQDYIKALEGNSIDA